jgi:hypothetical protein
MLKFFFWILLLANSALFAYQQGYLDALVSSGREPARMSNQFNADKIRLIPASAAADSSAAATNKPELAACTEIGNFNAEDARRFEAKLAALALGDRISRRGIQEVASHIVYIPPQGDKEGADKKAGELRRMGVTDFYIIQDNSNLRWGISLGVFKQEEAARAHLASLNQKGVHSARIGQRSVTANMVAFQLKDLEADMKTAVEKVKAEFPRQDVRECASI